MEDPEYSSMFRTDLNDFTQLVSELIKEYIYIYIYGDYSIGGFFNNFV